MKRLLPPKILEPFRRFTVIYFGEFPSLTLILLLRHRSSHSHLRRKWKTSSVCCCGGCKSDRHPVHQTTAPNRRSSQRDHTRQMGIRRLGKSDFVGPPLKIRPSPSHSAQFRRARTPPISPAEAGQPVYLSIAGDWSAICIPALPLVPNPKRAGLVNFRLHDLRHSFASFLVNSGVAIYTVQNLLGHVHVRATQRYAHLSNDTLADAAEVIPNVVLAPAQIATVDPDKQAASSS